MGNSYWPFGSASPCAAFPESEVGGLGPGHFVWSYGEDPIGGLCEIELPPGDLGVNISKGPEYEAIRQTVHLPEGKMSLRFTLSRRIDPSKQGWYAGAMVHSPDSPHEVLHEAMAEGIQIVNLLAYERERLRFKGSSPPLQRPSEPLEGMIDYPNLVAFSGQGPCLQTPDCLLAVNTLNGHETLGRLALLNCHRPVFPLRFGRSAYEQSAYHRPDTWTLADWCEQCHRKGGLVVGLDLSDAQLEPEDWWGGEALADLVLGKIDAVAVHCFIDLVADNWWYALLSAGFQIPIVAWPGPLLRCQRTYARLSRPLELSYSAWINAVHAGRTAVSEGPFVTLTVNGEDPGATCRVDSNRPLAKIHAQALARDPFDELQIIENGQIVLAQRASHDGVWRATIETELELTCSGWLAARCTFTDDVFHKVHTNAHTSPVYLCLDGKAAPVDTLALRRICESFDHGLRWVEHEARCETPKQRERLANVFLQAKQKLNEMASRGA
jgi:hypothetical protein